MRASKNLEFAQMQGAEKIPPRRICWICKQEIFYATQHNQPLGCRFLRLSGMAITNDLPSVFCWVSQMASSHISSSISWDEMWIFRGSLMQQQGLLDRHGANRHQSAGQQTKQQHAQAVHAD